MARHQFHLSRRRDNMTSRFGSLTLLLGAVSLVLLLQSLSHVAAAPDDKFYLYDEADYDEESPQHQDGPNSSMSHAGVEPYQQQQQQEQQRQLQLQEQQRQQQEQQRQQQLLQQQQEYQRRVQERQRQIEEQQRREQQQSQEQQQQSQEQQQQSQEQQQPQQPQEQLQQQQEQQKHLQEQQRLQQHRLQQEQQRREQLLEQQKRSQQQQERQQPQPQPESEPPQTPQSESGPTYRPVPPRVTAAPLDPNVIFVPRLGSVRGRVPYRTLSGNRAINAFLGVKYGNVRPGLGRFQRADAPRYDLALDDAVVDATREAAACPQFPDLERIQEEVRRGVNVDDCLTLNIYAPNKPGSYPVLVFVHGEMLFDGSAEEGQPDYFLEHDVVLVSLNYRLAPFGFLTSLTDELPGNVALADLQMALEWVQQYIYPFGGDPAKVTLLGQAGGATLVHALSLSGKAEGLFHQLILQSGTALNPYFLDETPLETFRALARAARCPTVTGLNLPNAIACFERLSTPELLAVFKRHWEENESRGLRYAGGFKLSIGDRLGYLPQHPAAMVARSTYPLLAGTTKDAGTFILSRFYQQLAQVRTRNITDYVDVVLKHTAQPRHHGIWKQWALREIFTPEDVRSPTLQGLAQGLLELVNLILYRAPLIDSIRYTSPKQPTFLYVFDFRGEFHRFGFLPNPLPFQADATLSDDNIYLFPYPEEVSQLNAADRAMARTLTTHWYNFVQFGTPTPGSDTWPNVTSEYGPFVRIIKSQEQPLELDYHFGEGIPVPNLYPEWFTTTTTTTTTTPRYPYYPTPPSHSASNPNYPSQQHNPAQQHNPSYAAARPTPPPAWRAHETVLEDPNALRMPPPQQQRYPGYPVYSSHAKNIQDKRYRSAKV